MNKKKTKKAHLTRVSSSDNNGFTLLSNQLVIEVIKMTLNSTKTRDINEVCVVAEISGILRKSTILELT